MSDKKTDANRTVNKQPSLRPKPTHNGNGNGNGNGSRKMSVEEIRFSYLKAVTGYDWTDENVKMLNEEMSKDVEVPEVNKLTSWPSIR
jgi:hypothetical protein